MTEQNQTQIETEKKLIGEFIVTLPCKVYIKGDCLIAEIKRQWEIK